jgi:hypothetical protein
MSDPRHARLVGLAGFVVAAALPIVLWHRAISFIASDFHLELSYLVTGWTGYALIAAALVFFIPVLISIGRNPSHRWYPRSRNAYLGWGTSLYVMGIALASQVATIADGPASP